MNSVMAIPIGILMFLISFWVLFKNEGLPNMGKIADTESAEVSADEAGNDGEFVSVTGELESDSILGDPNYLSPGNYINLARDVEMYAWVEHTQTETRDKVGGGTETTTTYTYEMEWTSNPRTSGFEDPSYNNPAMQIQSESWSGDSANIGVWQIDVDDARWPSGETLSPSSLPLLGQASRGTVSGDYVYLGYGGPGSPGIGDHRISFRALSPGGTVTGFGEASQSSLTAYNYEDNKTFLRVLNGTRAEAIETLLFEAAALKWGLRILGFFLMWFGMQMVFAPLHAVAGILPFVKKGTKFIIALITFPIAAILTLLTIVISAILHSVVALVVVFAITAALMGYLWKNRGKDGEAAPAAAPVMPPPGPAPGANVPPPGPPPA